MISRICVYCGSNPGADGTYSRAAEELADVLVNNDIELVYGEVDQFPREQAAEFCGVVVQTPDNIGNMRDYTELFGRFREH